MASLTGKVIIVTGAGSGIGAATAKELARSGAKVMLASLDGNNLLAVSDDIKKEGGECIYSTCDVCKNEEVKKTVDLTLQKYGTVNGLVNNAGTIQPLAKIIDADVALWRKCIETHLIGSLQFVKAVLPLMLKNNEGTIVNVSSGAAEIPLTGWGAYNTAKASLKMFSQLLYDEVQGTHIKIFSVKPGAVDTKMQEEIRDSKINDIPVANVPREKLTPPGYPATAIGYLFTQDADDLAGIELDVRKAPLAGRF